MKLNLPAKILLAAAGLVVLVLAGFVIWGLTPQAPDAMALAAMDSAAGVDFSRTPRDWLVFMPPSSPAGAQAGVVLYPGAHVDWRSYSALARELALRGLAVVVVPMPLSLALLDPGAGSLVPPAYPGITSWYLAGHSLGGAMAAAFLADEIHRADFRGLILLGAYSTSDLSKIQEPVSAGSGSGKLAVLSVSASLDGLSTPKKIADYRRNLPAHTWFAEIAGGNHAQFGNYGLQSGDQVATLSPQDQRTQTADLVAAFVAEYSPGALADPLGPGQGCLTANPALDPASQTGADSE